MRIFCALSVLVLGTNAYPEEKAIPGLAEKNGLSLTIELDKKSYQLGDELKLTFHLKNTTKEGMYIGDGYPAPKIHEVGPKRHFELHITPKDGKESLYFWSLGLTEGITSGIRRVFLLKPGETYTGSVLIPTTAREEQKAYVGSFEDKTTRKEHVLGRDSQKYKVRLLYQVHPESHGVYEPPVEFKKELLWTGELITEAIEVEITKK